MARGTTSTPGGQITATAGTITIGGYIDATGAPGGGVSLTSTGALTLSRPARREQPGQRGRWRQRRSRGYRHQYHAAASTRRGSGVDSSGGDIDVSASGALVLAAAIDASGSDGGSIDLGGDAR